MPYKLQDFVRIQHPNNIYHIYRDNNAGKHHNIYTHDNCNNLGRPYINRHTDNDYHREDYAGQHCHSNHDDNSDDSDYTDANSHNQCFDYYRSSDNPKETNQHWLINVSFNLHDELSRYDYFDKRHKYTRGKRKLLYRAQLASRSCE